VLKIVAIILIIGVALYLFGSLFVKNKTKFHKKPAILVLVASVGLLIASSTIFASDDNKLVSAPEYIQKAPNTSKAPYAIQTTSRLYYVVSYQDQGDVVTLSDYFSYDKNKWQRYTIPLELNRAMYPVINIYNR